MWHMWAAEILKQVEEEEVQREWWLWLHLMACGKINDATLKKKKKKKS